MLRVYVLSVSRVPVFFHEGTWHIYEGTCVVQGCLICFSFSSPRVSPNFGGTNEATNLWTRILWWRIMFHVRAIALYPFNTMWNSRYILNYDDENVRKIQKTFAFAECHWEVFCMAPYSGLLVFGQLWLGAIYNFLKRWTVVTDPNGTGMFLCYGFLARVCGHDARISIHVSCRMCFPAEMQMLLRQLIVFVNHQDIPSVRGTFLVDSHRPSNTSICH